MLTIQIMRFYIMIVIIRRESMMIKYIKFSLGVILFGLFLTACTHNTSNLSDLEASLFGLVDRSQDDYLDMMKDEELSQLIVLDSIQYGAFTEVDSDEVMVIFKFMDVPHAGGLDRTLVLICDARSLKVKLQHTFVADHVELHLLLRNDLRNEILYIGSTTYQGETVYGIERYDLSTGKFESKSISENDFERNAAFIFSNDILQVFELSYADYEPVYTYQNSLFWDSYENKFKMTFN
jgi:hypothetical protein